MGVYITWRLYESYLKNFNKIRHFCPHNANVLYSLCVKGLGATFPVYTDAVHAFHRKQVLVGETR